jgi:hypothetical protein
MTVSTIRQFSQKTILYAELHSTVDGPQAMNFPTDFIGCLLSCADWSKRQDQELSKLIEALITKGAVFLGFWGFGSERVHDIAEDLLMLDNPNAPMLPIPVAWEDQESLEEELYNFVFAYAVDEQFQTECSWIVLNIDRCISRERIVTAINRMKSAG